MPINSSSQLQGEGFVFTNIILVVSLIANCLFAYIMFQPVNAATNAVRMTCSQARSDVENKRAVIEFADRNGSSFSKTHEFLRNSDYELRNISIDDGRVVFVYTSSILYTSTCGIHLPGTDGGIVRVGTDLAADPAIRSVW
jgi:hypothetical protein